MNELITDNCSAWSSGAKAKNPCAAASGSRRRGRPASAGRATARGRRPCTHLASSGARWFPEKRADGRQQEGIDFFMKFVEFHEQTGVPVAIENPIGIMSTKYRKPDQIIHPWQFGHPETKATCLWLHGLPKLKPTDIVEGREPRVWKMPPSEDRWKKRSLTYQGIASAMSEQWTK